MSQDWVLENNRSQPREAMILKLGCTLKPQMETMQYRNQVKPLHLWGRACIGLRAFDLEILGSLCFSPVMSVFIAGPFLFCFFLNILFALGFNRAAKRYLRSWVQFSSVAQSCPILCNPIDCSTPGFPLHHQLLELTQAHVHWVGDAIQPSHPLYSSSPAFNHSQHQGLFKWVSSLHQVAKVLVFQLQHQSFQWIFRTDFLEDGLAGSPCCPTDSQGSSPTPQFLEVDWLQLLSCDGREPPEGLTWVPFQYRDLWCNYLLLIIIHSLLIYCTDQLGLVCYGNKQPPYLIGFKQQRFISGLCFISV